MPNEYGRLAVAAQNKHPGPEGPGSAVGEIFGLAFVLVTALALITVVGHSIWLLLETVFGARRDRRAETSSVAYCPQCRAILEPESRLCRLCGWAGLLDDLRRQVERCRWQGLLDEPTTKEILSVLDRLPAAARPSAESVTAPRAANLVQQPPQVPTPAPVEAVLAEIVEPATALPHQSSAEVLTPSPEIRVQQYIKRREALPAQSTAVEPPERAKPVAQLLAAFMDEKNIRWGELVGGLLIVCCSIALVVSFWAAIAERPFVKFFLFNGVTAALFGAGYYTEHRWRLPTTSHGLLLIATLLVPLNFLAIAAFTQTAAPTDVLTIGGELLSMALFAGLVFAAGRVLVPEWPGALTVGILGTSVSELLVRRFVTPEGTTATWYLMAAAPLACYVGACGWALHKAGKWVEVGECEANRLFRLFGPMVFAVVLPLGLLLVKTNRFAAALAELSPLLTLVAAPILTAGLFLWHRLADSRLTGIRTAGTSLAVFGALVQLAALVLAWPQPATMLVAAVLNTMILAAAAVWYRLPAAHVVAAGCLTVAYLVGYHLGWGRLAWRGETAAGMLAALLSASSGAALVPLAACLLGVAEGWRRRDRRAEAFYYVVAAAGTAAVSLALASWFGFGVAGDPSGVTWIYLLYAVAAMVVAGRLGRPAAAWLGAALLLATFIQAVVFRYGPSWQFERSWPIALCGHATLCAIAVAAGTELSKRWRRSLSIPLGYAALASSAACAVLVCWQAPSTALASSSRLVFWIAGVWLLLAAAAAHPVLFAAFQAALAASVVLAVAAGVEDTQWLASSGHGWLDARHLQAQGIALALFSCAWLVARMVSGRWLQGVGDNSGALQSAFGSRSWAAIAPERRQRWQMAARRLLFPPWPPLDQRLFGFVFSAMAAMTLAGIVPCMAAELALAPRAAALPVGSRESWHEHALGLPAWALLAAVSLTLAVDLRRRFTTTGLLALVAALAMTVPLLAGRWEKELAAASALRWYAAMYFLTVSVVLWGRERLAGWMGWLLRPRTATEAAQAARSVLLLVMSLAATPPIAIGILLALFSIAGTRTAGPAAGSLFAEMGAAVSYAVPLVITAAALLGHALWRRQAGYLVAATLLLNLAVSAGYLASTAGGALTPSDWLRLGQYNVLSAAGCALAWVAAKVRAPQWTPWTGPLAMVPVALAVWIKAAILVLGTAYLFWRPALAGPLVDVADVWGWTSFLLAATAFVTAHRTAMWRLSSGAWCGGWLAAGAMIAATTARWDNGNWLALHTLLVMTAAGGWVVLGAAAWRHWFDDAQTNETPSEQQAFPPARLSTSGWAMVPGGLTVLIALRALVGDPHFAWWTIGGLLAVAGLCVATACWSAQRRFLYLGGSLFNLAATIWWLAEIAPLSLRSFASDVADLAVMNAVVLALPAAAWLIIELRVMRPRWHDGWRAGVGFHRVAAALSLALLATAVALGLAADVSSRPLETSAALVWLAVASTASAVFSCQWDDRAHGSTAKLYLLGLLVLAVALDRLDLQARWLGWTGTMFAAAYSLATSFLWSRRNGLRQLADRLRMPRGPEMSGSGLRWLVPANTALALAVVAAAYWIVLSFEVFGQRTLAANAALVQAVALGLLARGQRQSELRRSTLLVAVVAAVAWGWAWLPPGTNAASLLHRAVAALAAVAVMTGLYSLGLVKLLGRHVRWVRAAQQLVPLLVATSGALVVLVMSVEAWSWTTRGEVPISGPAIVVVAVSLGGLLAGCLAAALLPGRDPLGMSERGRTVYVYAAEAMAALLFMHIRLSMPWLFHGWFVRYWPLIVMLLAFLGVGFSELFRRQRRLVLADPLERTGALLPLLPVLGFWILPARVHYSLLLVTAGALYAVLSIMRRSFGFGLIAALAANGGLWYLLARTDGFGLLEHPQVWLIPPALCVLAAAYLNRDRLSNPQMTTIRYLAGTTIYVSSTADIFLVGVANAPWLPLVLAGASVAGIFAGILMRVRAFLYLGTSFLMLALMTVIWYAAVDLHQTWIWSLAGIITGILIIALFAVFEKKRGDVLRLVEHLQQWER